MGEPGLSRRTLLRGAGVATGATLLGGVSAAAAAQGDGSPPGVATVKGPDSLDQGRLVQALPARNAAYQYRTVGWHQFFPLANPMPGVTFSGSAGMQATSSATFYCPLDLPQGAVVREVGVRVLQRPPHHRLGRRIQSDGPGQRLDRRVVRVHHPERRQAHDRDHEPAAVRHHRQRGLRVRAVRRSSRRAQFGFFGARVAWSNGLLLSQLSPQARKLDTRNPGPLTGKIITGQTKTLALTPELIVGAKSALVNLTITNTEGSGFLGLFPSRTPVAGNVQHQLVGAEPDRGQLGDGGGVARGVDRHLLRRRRPHPRRRRPARLLQLSLSSLAELASPRACASSLALPSRAWDARPRTCPRPRFARPTQRSRPRSG